MNNRSGALQRFFVAAIAAIAAVLAVYAAPAGPPKPEVVYDATDAVVSNDGWAWPL